MAKAPPRKKPNMSEKLAAALRKIRLGVDGERWLIPEPLRSEGSAKAICSACDFDHIRRWAEGGGNEPQNLDPMLRADHRAKTIGKRGDIAEVAKGKRFGAKEAAFRARLLAKAEGREVELPRPTSAPMAGGRRSGLKRKLDGTVVKR